MAMLYCCCYAGHALQAGWHPKAAASELEKYLVFSKNLCTMVQLNPCTKEHVLSIAAAKAIRGHHGTEKMARGFQRNRARCSCWKMIEELGRTDSARYHWRTT